MLEKNLRLFCESKFGLFIHWGIYSVSGGRWHGKHMDYIGEWLQSRFRIPHTEYAKLTEFFNPLQFNAEEWIEKIAEAGAKYIVFTAKHHDGFAMYHSKFDRYNVVDSTPFKRDPLKELEKACRKYGLQLGIYYSHCLDWNEFNAADPGPLFPKNFGMSWGNDWDFPDKQKKNFATYLNNKVKIQLHELLTNYGNIFSLWLDCPVLITKEQTANLKKYIRSLQPACLVNSRIGHGYGDFGVLGDNQIPAGKSFLPLESPNTLNNTWGFKWDDHAWKTTRDIVENLVASNAKNVNYLLNIGPRPDGRFPDVSIDVLNEISKWRRENAVVISKSSPSPFPSEFPWGWCTVYKNMLQLFIKNSWQELLEINGIKNRIIACSAPWQINDTNLKINPAPLKDDILRVINVELEGAPDIDTRIVMPHDILELSPVFGEIIYGSTESVHDQNLKLGAAAEVLSANTKCCLGATGTLQYWQHHGDGIRWKIYFPQRGEYRISIVTENFCHTAIWVGAREVEINFGYQSFRSLLNQDDSCSNNYYASAISHLGVIHVESESEELLTIKNIRITDKEAQNMSLKSIYVEAINRLK